MSVPPQRAAEVLARFRQQKPEAARLAELVCLATRIEQGLLREARLSLAPGMDAGAEADLWFSPLVESWSARGFVLSPAIATLLQAELLRNHERAYRAWTLLHRLHATAPPVVQVEEEVTWLALARGKAALQDIEAALRKVLRTMLHDERQASGVARWALRALPRLPPLVWETEAARLLAFGAAARQGARALSEGAVALPQQDARWLLPQAGNKESLAIRVEWSPSGLTFFHGLTQSQGSALLVPNTYPLLLEVVWHAEDQEQHRLVEVRDGASLPIPVSVTALQLRTVAGDEFRLVARAPHAGVPSPRYLDETSWSSCAWIPGRKVPTTAYFIGRTALLTAASAFPDEAPGTPVEVISNRWRLVATLLKTDTQAGYALLEVPEGSLVARPPEGVLLLDIDSSIPVSLHTWIAYGLVDGVDVWIEGLFEPARSVFLATGGSVALHEFPLGGPIFLGGLFLVGHVNGWNGEQVILGRGNEARQAFSELRTVEPHDISVPAGSEPAPGMDDVPEKETSPVQARLDELRQRIHQEASVEPLLLLELQKHLQDHEITSKRLPSKAVRATISQIGNRIQVSLDLQSLELTDVDVARLNATIELENVTLTLLIRHSEPTGWSEDEEDAAELTGQPIVGWSADDEEAEALVSLRVHANVVILTETPEDGVEMISAAYIPSIEDIEVVAVHSRPRPRKRAKNPLLKATPKKKAVRKPKEGLVRTFKPSNVTRSKTSSTAGPRSPTRVKRAEPVKRRWTAEDPVRVVCVYSSKDEKQRLMLEKHLTPLQREGLISIWHDQMIRPGEKWALAYFDQLYSADMFLLLVSPDLLSSDFTYSSGMQLVLERQERGTAKVIPVLLRDSNWQELKLARIQALPGNGLSIRSWRDQDAAWRNVSEGIARVAEDIRKSRL